ncbi:MAG: hypothetical protein WDN31_02340 [Hyphomicrobium sp.]
MATLYGYLHSWAHDVEGAFQGSGFGAFLNDILLSKSDFGSRNNALRASGRWTSYIFHSPVPLMGEDESGLFREGYTYRFYVCIMR